MAIVRISEDLISLTVDSDQWFDETIEQRYDRLKKAYEQADESQTPADTDQTIASTE